MDLRHLTCLQKLYVLRTSWIFETPFFGNETKIISGGSTSQPGGVFSRLEGPSGEGRGGVSPCVCRGPGWPPPPRENFGKNKAKWCNLECKPSLLHALKLSFIFSDAASFRAVPLPLFRTECL